MKTPTKLTRVFSIVLCAFLVPFSLTSCDDDPLEDAGDDVEDAVDDASDEVEDAVDGK